MVSVSSFCEFLDNIPAIEATHLDIRDYMAFVAQKGRKYLVLKEEQIDRTFLIGVSVPAACRFATESTRSTWLLCE